MFRSVIGDAFAAFASSYAGLIGACADREIFLYCTIHEGLLTDNWKQAMSMVAKFQ